MVFDDFYFIPKSIQPEFIDYFHRICKETPVFLKVATIKHRTVFYKKVGETYVGVEPIHDAQEIDLDYTLDDYDELQKFMRRLLQSAIDASKASLRIDDLFAGEGLSQLGLASGGVPRDFLSLFVKLAHDSVTDDAFQPIGKTSVNEAAISVYGEKLSSMKTDSPDEKEILDGYLNYIKDSIYRTKRTNAFLISKQDLESHQSEKNALRELADLRLIHLVDSNTSAAPSDGQMYEAYIMDLALYDNARPRDFRQIEPGKKDDKSRRDDLRASPRITLEKMHESVRPKVSKEHNTPSQN